MHTYVDVILHSMPHQNRATKCIFDISIPGLLFLASPPLFREALKAEVGRVPHQTTSRAKWLMLGILRDSHRHGPNKFPLHHHHPPTTHVHNSTAYPHAYATSSQVSTTTAGSKPWPTRYIFAYHAPRRAYESALVDSVRLTHYLLDSLFQPETLVSYTKRRLESWYVSLWCIA